MRFVCFHFIPNSAAIERDNQIRSYFKNDLRFYNYTNNQHPSMKGIKSVEANLRRATNLPNSKKLFLPMQIMQGDRPELPAKLTDFKGLKVRKDKLITISIGPILSKFHIFYHKTAQQIIEYVRNVIDNQNIADAVDFDTNVWEPLHKKTFVKKDCIKPAELGDRIRIALLFENLDQAMNCYKELRLVEVDFKWNVIPPKIMHAKTYAEVDLRGMMAHWFTDLDENVVANLEPREYDMIFHAHGDGVGHHPQVTMLMASLVSKDGIKFFQSGHAYSRSLPKYLIVGSDKKCRKKFVEVLREIAHNHDVGYYVKENPNICLRICVDPVVVCTDRAMVPVTTGSATPGQQSAATYAVEFHFSFFRFSFVPFFALCSFQILSFQFLSFQFLSFQILSFQFLSFQFLFFPFFALCSIFCC